jgi:hypothetical protein
MRTFKINEKIEVVCDWQKTRYGFRHLAHLMLDGKEIEYAKVCYYNRTWECYEYQTVMLRLFEKSTALSEEDKKLCKVWANGDHTDWTPFKTVSAIAKMGDILCQGQKEKNDWKARMIKAGLGDKGLIMPEDWDSLDEDTKESRLNMVLEQISKVGK